MDELRQRFNPDGSDLRRQQLILLDMLGKFDLFCKASDIEYWLSSGTALGAKRHSGFIPWDDDMDVEMLKDDYDKLYKMRDELFKETGIVIQDHKSDFEYIAPYPKLRDTNSELIEIHGNDANYKYKGIYIDIFIREKCSYLTCLVTHGLQYFSYKFTRIKSNRPRRILKLISYNMMHKILFPIFEYIDRIFYRADAYRVIKGSGFYKAIPKTVIFPLKNLSFENSEFPVTNDIETYLKILFGNYNKLPNLDSIRIHYNKIKFFS